MKEREGGSIPSAAGLEKGRSIPWGRGKRKECAVIYLEQKRDDDRILWPDKNSRLKGKDIDRGGEIKKRRGGGDHVFFQIKGGKRGDVQGDQVARPFVEGAPGKRVTSGEPLLKQNERKGEGVLFYPTTRCGGRETSVRTSSF